MAAGDRTRTLRATFPTTLAHCSPWTGHSISKPCAHNATRGNNTEASRRKIISQMCVYQTHCCGV